MIQLFTQELEMIYGFLPCETPDAWVQEAIKPENRDLLLIDHAHCEKKAASTAMTLMFRYVDRPDLLRKMSRLAREELIHFDQVMKIMFERGIEYVHLTPARYAAGLRVHARHSEPEKLVDVLIIGALIEARSCERFAKIAPFLDSQLNEFYTGLLKSEARHFRDYLSLAHQYAGRCIDDRIALFCEAEKALMYTVDEAFRFHSGLPS